MAETKTAPKKQYQDEAKTAVDRDARQGAQVDVLASQLEQQDKARTDVPDAAEQTSLAAHTAEGGGAWPEDLLRDRFLQPQGSIAPAFSPEQNYTSHENS